MRRARWLAEWRGAAGKPVLYHVISRVVDRRFVLGTAEKEKFRTLMRMQENFTGCRVLSYCLMDNHFHLLLEVPLLAEEGLSDEELLSRLLAIYDEGYVAFVAKELADARAAVYLKEDGMADALAAIHQRFTYRMHSLGEFMKGLLQRFTQSFNRLHARSGTLWEERFKSVIVEDGAAARTISAYIDLNPVRAGMVQEPATFRWSSYGEAVGGGKKGNGKKAREGLVRAYRCDQGVGFDATKWNEVSRLYRRLMGLALAGNPGRVAVSEEAKGLRQTTTPPAELSDIPNDDTKLKDLGTGKMLRCRIRYFTDGAVIGSKQFVNDAFTVARDRFGPKRKDGARRLRGIAMPAIPVLWSVRDLRKGVV